MAPKTTFEKVQTDYLSALEWIKGFVSVSPSSRLMRYAKDLVRISEINLSNEPRDFAEEDMRLCTSAYEISEVIKIHQNLRGLTGQGLAKRLAEMATGPDGYIDEVPGSSSNLSRNSQFELYMAAELVASGFETSLDHETADIVFQVGQQTIFVECKRPQSAKAIPKCVKDAQKQLEVRYATHNDGGTARGLIAICADRPINPDFSIMLVNSEEEVNRSLYDMLDILIEAKSPETNKSLERSSQTLGAIYRAAIPTIVEPLGMSTYSVARRVQHFLPDVKHAELKLLLAILDRLQRGIRADFDRRFNKEN